MMEIDVGFIHGICLLCYIFYKLEYIRIRFYFPDRWDKIDSKP